MAKLKAAIITDIHHGPNVRAKLGKKAMKLLKKFVKAVNENKPDLIVDMGDRVTGKNADADRVRMIELKDEFNKAAAPAYHILGNHDVKNLSRAENETITGSPSKSWSRDVGGYHLIFFNPGDSAGNTLSVGQTDLDWLTADLAVTDKPSVVFSHVPLDNESEKQDAAHPDHRELHARFGYSSMGPKIREIMEKSGKVILCMSGHVHADKYQDINGIHYVTQQSLTHAYRKHYKIPSNAWSWLELEDGKITIRQQGKIPRDYNLTPRI